MSRHYPDIPLSERRGLSVLETAALYGISRATVYNLIANRKLTTSKIMGRRIILRESAEALLRPSHSAAADESEAV
jgi:excisionase family DNA binding protein